MADRNGVDEEIYGPFWVELLVFIMNDHDD